MNNTDTDTFEDYRVYKVGLFLWQFGSPVLILVGTIGNVLSILVLLRPKLRQSTTMFYLMCLSVGDLLTLYTGLLRYWISFSFDSDIRNVSSISCKLHTFLVYYSLDFTVWSLVSVTIDRCLSVSLPFRSKQICTIPKARIVVGIILIALLFKNLHFFWTIDLVHTWEFRCDGNTPDRIHFLRFVWPYIDLATFCVIPFSIMIVANIKIIFEIIRSQRKMQAHSSTRRGKPDRVKLTSQTSHQQNKSVNSLDSVCRGDSDSKDTTVGMHYKTNRVPDNNCIEDGSSQSIDRKENIVAPETNCEYRNGHIKENRTMQEYDEINSTGNTKPGNSHLETIYEINASKLVPPGSGNNDHVTENVRPRRQRQISEGSEHLQPTHDRPTSGRRSTNRVPSLTAMLLTVNCVFLVTTFPVQVFLIGEAYWFANETGREIAFYQFWWAAVNMLQYLNNAIHFFLYCLTGPRFREELKVMLNRTNKVTTANVATAGQDHTQTEV